MTDEQTEFPLNPQAVEFGRKMGRMEAERDAAKLIGRLVVAAGGVIEIPDRLVVADDAAILVVSDRIAGMTIYQVRNDAAERMGRAIG